MNFSLTGPLSDVIAHRFRSHRLQDIGLIPQLATRLPALEFRRRRRVIKMADISAGIYTQIVTCVIVTTRRYLPPYRRVEE